MSGIVEKTQDVTEIMYDKDFFENDKEWFSNQPIKVNDPIYMEIKNSKKEVWIFNYFLKPIKGAVLSVFDGKDDMPIYWFEELKPLHYYKMHIPIDRLSSISKTLTKDKIQFRMLNLGEEYEKVRNIDVSWIVNIARTYHKANSKAHSRNDIINILTQLTNFAYVLSSKEFETVIDNIESILNKKLDKLSWKDDKTNKTINEDESVRCWNLKDAEQKKKFFDIMGVRCSTYSTAKKTTFAVGMQSSNAKGHGITYGPVDQEKYKSTIEGSYGHSFYNRPEDMSISETMTISSVFIHEMAHIFGYQHYTAMCNGPLCETDVRVVQTLAYLIRKKLPYYDLLKKENTRCGFNSLEKWIYSNLDKFDDDMRKELEESIEARNKELDKVSEIVKSNDAYAQKEKELAGMPDFIKAGFLKQWGYKRSLDLTALDSEIFSQYGNISAFTKIYISI